jgi:hypothetical protein
MPRLVPRGHGRSTAPHGASVSERMTTGQLLARLNREGFHVTRRMLDHAVVIGMVPRPVKVGNWRRWTPVHADVIRVYLRDYSRVQGSRQRNGGAV